MNTKLKNIKITTERKIETLKGELLNINLKIHPKWVVVLDDSNCTVGVGGEGYLWEVHSSSDYSGGFYNLKGENGHLIYNYNQSIFRDATQKEIYDWLKNGICCPAIMKRRLYDGQSFSPQFATRLYPNSFNYVGILFKYDI